MNQESLEQEFLVFSHDDIKLLDPKLVQQLHHIKTTIAIMNYKKKPVEAPPLKVVGYRHAIHGDFHDNLESFAYSFGDSKQAVSLADASPMLRVIADLQDALTRAEIALVASPTITAEMKSAMIGEYKIDVEEHCSACDINGTDPNCEACNGTLHYIRKVTVPWTMCKDIFKSMTGLSRAAACNSQATPAPGTGYVPVHKVLSLLDLFQSGKLTPNTPSGWKTALQLDAFEIHGYLDGSDAGGESVTGHGQVGDTIQVTSVSETNLALIEVGHKGKIIEVHDDGVFVDFKGWLGQPVSGDGEWMLELGSYVVTAQSAVISRDVLQEAL